MDSSLFWFSIVHHKTLCARKEILWVIVERLNFRYYRSVRIGARGCTDFFSCLIWSF